MPRLFDRSESPVCFDTRGCELCVSDEVIYAAEQQITQSTEVGGEQVIKVTRPRLKQSRIVTIQIHEGTGFAEVGNKVTIILEDGHYEEGDSENGGWAMLRLHDRGVKPKQLVALPPQRIPPWLASWDPDE